jgi:hypothetical protein
VNLGHFLLPAQGRLSADETRVLARVAPLFPSQWRVGNVHPSRSEQRALSHFEAISERKWDLKFRSAVGYDALVVGRLGANTRVQSALASCRVLVVVDGAGPHIGSDRLLGRVELPRGSLYVYRGDLTDPLLRVDDYPTGVRPIWEDLTLLHDVLTLIDDAGLPFHLGVVPAILEDRMVPFLRGLKHLVVSQHGYEHGYAKHSKMLIDAGDPFNQRSTVTGFDEFAARSDAEVESLLRRGREILVARLGRAPLSYIPPNNMASRPTARALLALGFEYVLTERRFPGCELPCIASDFYDRSATFLPESRPRVASLHVTWEADLLKAGDSASLPKFLAALVAQRTRAREEASEVAERILSAVARG